jgi:hypothetical protein
MIREPANGLNVCGLKPGQGNGFLMAIKIHRTPYFRGDVRPETQVIRFYSM